MQNKYFYSISDFIHLYKVHHEFQKNFNFLVANYKQIYYNKDLPENIRSKFTLNNEAFISNIIQKEKIEVKNLPQSWHHILNHESVLEDYKNSKSFFYHFINCFISFWEP